MMMMTAINRKRPTGVWVISIFYLVSAAFSAFSYYIVYSGKVVVSDAQAAYFAGLTGWDHLISAMQGILSVSGAVALFAMKRPAPYLFSANMVLGAGVTVWQIVTKGWMDAIGVSGAIGALMGWTILIAVCIYAWRLLKKGWLT
jgi:hypothetical protein